MCPNKRRIVAHTCYHYRLHTAYKSTGPSNCPRSAYRLRKTPQNSHDHTKRCQPSIGRRPGHTCVRKIIVYRAYNQSPTWSWKESKASTAAVQDKPIPLYLPGYHHSGRRLHTLERFLLFSLAGKQSASKGYNKLIPRKGRPYKVTCEDENTLGTNPLRMENTVSIHRAALGPSSPHYCDNIQTAEAGLEEREPRSENYFDRRRNGTDSTYVLDNALPHIGYRTISGIWWYVFGTVRRTKLSNPPSLHTSLLCWYVLAAIR